MERNQNILHVVDMSPCIYAGSFNRRSFIQGDVVNTGNGYRERNIPTGGTSMLFNILGQYMGTGPIAFVADRNPTIKKELYQDYKGSRTHPNDVSIGKEVAEYILKDCGFTIYAEEGYEADDVIYTIVRQNRMRYDHIFVHTADSDLYILVRDNVSILPTSSKAKTVTMDNYTYLYAATGKGDFDTFIHLRDPATGETIPLTDEGAVITQKLSEVLDVGVGDTITLVDSDNQRTEVPVTAITENYI